MQLLYRRIDQRFNPRLACACLWLLLSVFSPVSKAAVSPGEASTGEISTQTVSPAEKCPNAVSPRADNAEPASENRSCGERRIWLDKGHQYVVNSTDSLAVWLDRFFGVEEEEVESAYSTLRLTLEKNWNEEDGASEEVRLRGKVHLPRVNKRLSLVFSDEEDNAEGARAAQLAEQKEENSVALQYELRKKSRSRVDVRLGVSSKLKGKASVRYRYKIPRDSYSQLAHRLTSRIRFRDGEGFSTDHRYDIDKKMTSDNLLRWSADINYGEETDGVEFSSRLSYDQRLASSEGLSTFIKLRGETRPEYLVNSYGVGIRYRKNIFRPWLYYGIEPSYNWLRHDRVDSRDGVAQIEFRLEIYFSDPS